MFLPRAVAIAAICCVAVFASDELTVYELLAPATHSFAITYDFYTSHAGAPYLFNPIRRGSVATDERVIDAATGKNLQFHVVSADDARQHGLQGKVSADSYIQVTLARPVPRGGEARVRIFKTYKDAASYSFDGDDIVFQRSLGIKRNIIVLPSGYELTGCGAPGIVSTAPDGRIRVSFVNDRDDELMVKLRGRLLK
ncbi:MAG: hypothetical protein ACR2NN_26770 [Bryobacteraceae bacterium]